MTKNQKVEVETSDEPVIDLQTLLKHSQVVDANVAEQDASVARVAAMHEHGLVEPSESKSNKATSALKNEIAELNKAITERDGQIESLRKQLESLHAAIATKEQQIDDLMEKLAEAVQPAPTIPPAIPTAPATAATGDKPNPFANA